MKRDVLCLGTLGEGSEEMSAIRFRKNVFYNFVGSALPIFVVILTIPRYLHVIGEARYGILVLIWTIFGYFNMFDFGVSRATTHYLSQLHASALQTRATVFYTAAVLSAAIGVFLAAAFYFVAFPAVVLPLLASTSLIDELLDSLQWLVIFFPLMLVTGVFVGTMEANERFLELNIQQVFAVTLLQCLPLAFVYWLGPSLNNAVLGAVVARAVSAGMLGISCIRWALPAGRPSLRLRDASTLLQYGKWVAFSNTLGPVLANADQFLIGLLIGAKAVAYYSVPFSLVTKTLIVPAAVARALFPRLSKEGRAEAEALSHKSLVTLSWVMSLLCAPAILVVGPAIEWWISEDFARESRLVAELLLVGAWANGLAFIPFTHLQSQNRPAAVAKIHALELLPFIFMLWLFVEAIGLPGAALAWCIRVLADGLLMFLAVGYNIRSLKILLMPGLTTLGALLLAVLGRPNGIFACGWALVIALSLLAWMLKHDKVLSAVARHAAQKVLRPSQKWFG